MTEPTLPPEPAKDATADELEADIAATRAQLGETIDALEDKLDVSAQAKRKVDQTKAELADKVNTATSRLTSKVDAVRTQVTDKVSRTKTEVTGKVGHTKAQVTDKVAQTKAKVTRKKGGPTTEQVSDPGYVADTVYPAEGGVGDSSLGSSRVTSTGQASRAQAVTGQVKHISTRLAAKVAEVRSRTNTTGSNDGSARRTRVSDGTSPRPTEPADSTASTVPTETTLASAAAAITGQLGQAKANLTGGAAQFSARTRQNPRSALPAAAAVLAVVVVTWLARRVISRPDWVVERA